MVRQRHSTVHLGIVELENQKAPCHSVLHLPENHLRSFLYFGYASNIASNNRFSSLAADTAPTARSPGARTPAPAPARPPAAHAGHWCARSSAAAWRRGRDPAWWSRARRPAHRRRRWRAARPRAGAAGAGCSAKRPSCRSRALSGLRSSSPATASAPSAPKSWRARSLTGSSRTTPLSMAMMRPCQKSRWMPSGWAKRRATSKGRLNPLGLRPPAPPSSSSSPSALLRVLRAILCALRAPVLLPVGGLQRPQEEGGEAGVFLQAGRAALAGARAQHLLQRQPGHRLPHIGEIAALVRLAGRGVAAQRDGAVFGVHHLAVLAVEFQRRADAGKDQVRAADAFGFEAGHPGGDAAGKFARIRLPSHR